MHRSIRILVAPLAAIGLQAAAQVPSAVGYQGRLLKPDGSPETGVVTVVLAVYNASAAGSSRGCEVQQVAVNDGFYALLLGNGSASCPGSQPGLTPSIFDGSDLWLEVSVGGAPMAPRQRIASVPYAYRAANARNVVGGTVEATSVAVGGTAGVSISSTGISLGSTTVIDGSGKATVAAGSGLTGDGSTAKPLGIASEGVTSALLASDAASLGKVTGGAAVVAGGNVGVGTTSPGAKLEVNGNVRLNSGAPDGARVVWHGGTGGAQEYRARVASDGHLGFFPAELQPEVLSLTQSANVGIGTPTPASTLHLSVPADDILLTMESFGPNANEYLLFRQARGTRAAPTALVAGDNTGSVLGRGYDGTLYINTAQIQFKVDGAVSAGAVPGAVLFYTYPSGTAQERMRITSSGNVGVGTASPVARLQIGDPFSGVAGAWPAALLQGLLVGQDTDNVFFGLKDEGVNAKRGAIVFGDDPGDFFTIQRNDPSAGLAELMRIYYDGTVGIGTSATGGLRLVSNGDTRIGGENVGGATTWGSALVFSGADSDSSDPLWLSRYNVSGNVTELRMVVGDDPNQDNEKFVIGTMQGSGTFTRSATWQPHFSVSMSGNVRARGSYTTTASPDLAETIPADDAVRPADVVCADPRHRERVVRCGEHGGHAVVGVISDGSSSFLINARASSLNAPLNGAPLVLAGRVPVRVTTENGPIRIGDSLTMSSTPGAAMRATESGPSVGIALESFEASTAAQGTVLCLVKVGEANLGASLARLGADNAHLRDENTAMRARLGRLERQVSALADRGGRLRARYAGLEVGAP